MQKREEQFGYTQYRKLLSFKKANGVSVVRNGVDYYVMDYEAQFETTRANQVRLLVLMRLARRGQRRRSYIL